MEEPRDDKPTNAAESPPEDEEVVEPQASYAALGLPLAVTVVVATLFFVLAGADATVELLTTAVATSTFAGKFIVIRGLHEGGFFDSPYKLALLVVYLDCLVGFIAVYNIGVLYKIPRFGKKLHGLQEAGREFLQRNPWMRKATFLGIIAFVMFPLSGTGAIGGAFVGGLLGLSKTRTMLGILIGAVFGSFGMAWLASVLGERLADLKDNPVYTGAGIVVLIVAGFLVYRFFKRATR